MFRFFYTRKWLPWSIGGTVLIVFTTWYQVQLSVYINEFFGTFYDLLQQALTTPNSVPLGDFVNQLMRFGYIAGGWVLIATAMSFFVSHWIFRWRQSMVEHYTSNWQYARDIEGSAQRVQEDTGKWANGVEDLGSNFLSSIMTLIAFTPILWNLSEKVTEILWFGHVSHSLVWVALVTSFGGTTLLAVVGIKLPGINYDIQRQESKFRKELVLGEDDSMRASVGVLTDLFIQVRKIQYKSYFHYGYFNIVRWSYFQSMSIVAYLVLAPTIVAGTVSLGFIQAITRAFGQVSDSLQFFAQSWSSIVELQSVYRRLREFEKAVETNKAASCQKD